MIVVFIAISFGILAWLFSRKMSIQKSRYDQEKATFDEKLPDYKVYTLSMKEKVVSLLVGAGVLYMIGFLFYKNMWISAILVSGAVVLPKYVAKQRQKKRQQELTLQFKQALFALSSALSAGRSLENAIPVVISDLRMLYPDPQTYIIRELEAMNNQLQNGIPIEKALDQFAIRSGVDDIRQFADVLIICKRAGGNIVQVIRRTTDLIADKLEIKQEINVMIAQKKFESKVLALAPLIIIAFLSFTSPEYMQPLYQGLGHGLMTVTIGMLAGCYWWIERTMRFEV